MREMRTGMPFGYIHARKGRRNDRAGTCGKLHRLRALRGRMSDGPVSHSSEFPPEKNAYDRLQPDAYAGAGDVADQSRRSNRTLTSRPVPKEMLDKIVEAAHCAPTATNSPKPFVYRRHRSAKATAGERLYDRRVRLLGEAIIESRREMCGQAVYEGCL